MDSPALVTLISVLLIVGSFFFVASEYALVSSRRGRVASLAKKSRRAKLVLDSLDDVGRLLTTNQLGITMVGIGVGSVTEPALTHALTSFLGASVPRAVGFSLSYLCVTYLVVVIGELVPKFLALHSPEPIAMWAIRPLLLMATILKPLVWLANQSAILILRPFGIRAGEHGDSFQKDEILMMVKSGQAGGALEQTHAEYITRALKLDTLTAKDIMIHRLDMKWLDLATPKDQLLNKMAEIPHSRVPVCRGDIDDVVGIAYLHDLVKTVSRGHLSLETILRQPVMVPENLTLDRIVSLMREERTQMVIVMDEYGGTSGLITLEDVVEEVFGELEDSIEGERPPVEVHPAGRITARADVRFDELVARLGIDLADEPSTDTLAEMITNEISRVPKIGDAIETPLGTMRVDNMARRRITRVSLKLIDHPKQIDRGS